MNGLYELDMGYNKLYPGNLSVEKIRWLERYDPDWRYTQEYVGNAGRIRVQGNLSRPLTVKNGTVWYSVPRPGRVNLQLFNAQGRLVKTLINGFKESGRHFINLKMDNVGSGIYYIKLKTGETNLTERMLITK